MLKPLEMRIMLCFVGPNVVEAFVSHYENFLGNTMTCDNLNIDGLFLNKVSDLANTNMVRPITDTETKAAMFDIGDDRALGPDGYTSAFFKKAWDIVFFLGKRDSPP
ncbi:hypothetical protein Tco_1347267, partial [Tanacetum coccineum]